MLDPDEDLREQQRADGYQVNRIEHGLAFVAHDVQALERHGDPCQKAAERHARQRLGAPERFSGLLLFTLQCSREFPAIRRAVAGALLRLSAAAVRGARFFAFVGIGRCLRGAQAAIPRSGRGVLLPQEKSSPSFEGDYSTPPSFA